MRILAIISLFLLSCPGSGVAQITCPAMAITRPNMNKGRMPSGFRSQAGRRGKSARMGDFFTGKKKSGHRSSGKDPFSFRSEKSGKVKEYSEFKGKTGKRQLFREYDEFARRSNRQSLFSNKDEFASRSKKKGRFRSYDEFASRSKREKRFRDFDEFAHRSRKRSVSRDGDEFAFRTRRTRKVNTDAQFNARTTVKRFNRSKFKQDEFTAKKKRGRQNKRDYTPFASSASPGGGPMTHRKPEIGLWGGSIGNRSGKDRRPMIPFPETEEKDD